MKMSISGAALEQVISICCVGYDTAYDKYNIDTKLRNFQAQRHIYKMCNGIVPTVRQLTGPILQY